MRGSNRLGVEIREHTRRSLQPVTRLSTLGLCYWFAGVSFAFSLLPFQSRAYVRCAFVTICRSCNLLWNIARTQSTITDKQVGFNLLVTCDNFAWLRTIIVARRALLVGLSLTELPVIKLMPHNITLLFTLLRVSHLMSFI